MKNAGPSRASIFRLMLVALFFLAAPTAGDIGSCNQRDDDLDPARFFAEKQTIDCQRCLECKLVTKLCGDACQIKTLTGDFPPGCFPLVHDGEVCLHALQSASCKSYAGYVADEGATIPTECDFCPAGEK